MYTQGKLHREDDGTLPYYAWPGGYPIVYLTAESDIMCATCANGKNGSDASEDHDMPMMRIVHAAAYWEGPDMQCCHCGKVMHSEYGDPENPE